MRIEKFLTWIQDKLLNYPDIDVRTVKMFVDKLNCCLSKKERERWNISIEMIREFTLKQISIDSFVNQLKVDELFNELDKLKEG